MFKYISNIAHKKILNVLVSILIIVFAYNATGCYSSYTGEVDPEDVEADESFDFIKVKMKDGLEINLKNKGAMIYKEYQGQRNVLVYWTSEMMRDESGVNKYTSKENVLQLKDIKSLLVNKEGMNTGQTILLSVLITSAIAVLTVYFIFLIAFSQKLYN